MVESLWIVNLLIKDSSLSQPLLTILSLVGTLNDHRGLEGLTKKVWTLCHLALCSCENIYAIKGIVSDPWMIQYLLTYYVFIFSTRSFQAPLYWKHFRRISVCFGVNGLNLTGNSYASLCRYFTAGNSDDLPRQNIRFNLNSRKRA